MSTSGTPTTMQPSRSSTSAQSYLSAKRRMSSYDVSSLLKNEHTPTGNVVEPHDVSLSHGGAGAPQKQHHVPQESAPVATANAPTKPVISDDPNEQNDQHDQRVPRSEVPPLSRQPGERSSSIPYGQTLGHGSPFSGPRSFAEHALYPPYLQDSRPHYTGYPDRSGTGTPPATNPAVEAPLNQQPSRRFSYGGPPLRPHEGLYGYNEGPYPPAHPQQGPPTALGGTPPIPQPGPHTYSVYGYGYHSPQHAPQGFIPYGLPPPPPPGVPIYPGPADTPGMTLGYPSPVPPYSPFYHGGYAPGYPSPGPYPQYGPPHPGASYPNDTADPARYSPQARRLRATRSNSTSPTLSFGLPPTSATSSEFALPSGVSTNITTPASPSPRSGLVGPNRRAPSFHLPAKGTTAPPSIVNTPKVGGTPLNAVAWAPGHQRKISDVASQMGGPVESESKELANAGRQLSSVIPASRAPAQPLLGIRAGAAVIGPALTSNNASVSRVRDPSFTSPGSVLFPASSRAEDALKNILAFTTEQTGGTSPRLTLHEGVPQSILSRASSPERLVESPVTVERGSSGVGSPTFSNPALVSLSPENMSEAGDGPESKQDLGLSLTGEGANVQSQKASSVEKLGPSKEVAANGEVVMSGDTHDALGTILEEDEKDKGDKIPSRDIAHEREREVSHVVSEHSDALQPDTVLKGLVPNVKDKLMRDEVIEVNHATEATHVPSSVVAEEPISKGDAIVKDPDALREKAEVTDTFQGARVSLGHEPESLDLSNLGDDYDSAQTPRGSDAFSILRTTSGESTTLVNINEQKGSPLAPPVEARQPTNSPSPLSIADEEVSYKPVDGADQVASVVPLEPEIGLRADEKLRSRGAFPQGEHSMHPVIAPTITLSELQEARIVGVSTLTPQKDEAIDLTAFTQSEPGEPVPAMKPLIEVNSTEGTQATPPMIPTSAPSAVTVSPADQKHQDVTALQSSALPVGTEEAPPESSSFLVTPSTQDTEPVVAGNLAPAKTITEAPRARDVILTSVSTPDADQVDECATAPALGALTVNSGDIRDGREIAASFDEINDIPTSSEVPEVAEGVSSQLDVARPTETQASDQSGDKPQLAIRLDSKRPDHKDGTELSHVPIKEDASAPTGSNGQRNPSNDTGRMESTSVTDVIISNRAPQDEALITPADKGAHSHEPLIRSDSTRISRDHAWTRDAIDVSNVSVESESPDGTVALCDPSTTESTSRPGPSTMDDIEREAIPSNVEAQYALRTEEYHTVVRHDQPPVPAEEHSPDREPLPVLGAASAGDPSGHLVTLSGISEERVSVAETVHTSEDRRQEDVEPPSISDTTDGVGSASAFYPSVMTAQDHITEPRLGAVIPSLPSNQSGELVPNGDGDSMRPIEASHALAIDQDEIVPSARESTHPTAGTPYGPHEGPLVPSAVEISSEEKEADPNTISVTLSEFPKASNAGEDTSKIVPVDALGEGDGAGVQQPESAEGLRSVAFGDVGDKIPDGGGGDDIPTKEPISNGEILLDSQVGAIAVRTSDETASIAKVGVAEQESRALASRQEQEVPLTENAMLLESTQSFVDNSETEATSTPEVPPHVAQLRSLSVKKVVFASPVVRLQDLEEVEDLSGERAMDGVTGSEDMERKLDDGGSAIREEDGHVDRNTVPVTEGSFRNLKPTSLRTTSSSTKAMADTISPSQSQESLSAVSEFASPKVSLTPTESEINGPAFEALDGRLAKGSVEQLGYPSPPPSDIELFSTTVESSTPHDEAIDHSLPRELAIDPDRLVGPQLRSILRNSPTSSYNRPSSLSPTSSSRIPTSTLDSSRRRRTSSSPVSTLYSPVRLMDSNSSLLNLSYPLRQIELASTVQTVPQETGFFTILGGFLVDMLFELGFLIWLFLKTAVPGIVTVLVHTVLVIVSGILTLLKPLTGYQGPMIKTKRRRVKPYPVSVPRMD